MSSIDDSRVAERPVLRDARVQTARALELHARATRSSRRAEAAVAVSDLLMLICRRAIRRLARRRRRRSAAFPNR